MNSTSTSPVQDSAQSCNFSTKQEQNIKRRAKSDLARDDKPAIPFLIVLGYLLKGEHIFGHFLQVTPTTQEREKVKKSFLSSSPKPRRGSVSKAVSPQVVIARILHLRGNRTDDINQHKIISLAQKRRNPSSPGPHHRSDSIGGEVEMLNELVLVVSNQL